MRFQRWLMLAFPSFHSGNKCSNLLEKTTDAVIKASKNGDLGLVSFSSIQLNISVPDTTNMLSLNPIYIHLIDSWRSFICKDIHFYRLTGWAWLHSIMLVVVDTKMSSDFWSLTLRTQSSIWLITRKVKRRFIKRRWWSGAASPTCLLPADPICSSKTTKGKHQKYWHLRLMIMNWRLISRVSNLIRTLTSRVSSQEISSIINLILMSKIFFLFYLFLLHVCSYFHSSERCRSRAISLLRDWIEIEKLCRKYQQSKEAAKPSFAYPTLWRLIKRLKSFSFNLTLTTSRGNWNF